MITYDIEEQKFINTVDGGIATHEEIKDHYDALLRKHKIQDCTPKQWDHCRVEKMGCAGCYYDHGIHLKAHELTAEEKPLYQHISCLHCGSAISTFGLGVPVYCEGCYQDLVAKYQEQLIIKKRIEELFSK